MNFASPVAGWNRLPVDLENADFPVGVAAQLDEKAAVESLLAERSNLTNEQRPRVARAIVEESTAANFDPVFVLAVMGVESSMNRDAVSNAGAKGLMQVRDATAIYLAEKERLGLGAGEIGDPALNVRVGVRYLSQLYRTYGDLSLALVAYNAGPGKLHAMTRHGHHLPDRYLEYPRRVSTHYRHLLAQLDESSLRVAHPLHLRVAAR